MKRKNRLKALVSNCFLCGKDLKYIEDKIGHRINPNKGNHEHNLLIVCVACKRLLTKIPIFKFILSKEVLKRYFSKLGYKSRKIILQKIKIMKNKVDKNNVL